METIPLAPYRRQRIRAARVREVPGADACARPIVRTEQTAGERVLADLALARSDAGTSGRILARFAAARVLAAGPDVKEARAMLAEWEPFVRSTAEGRALAAAVRTLDPAVRYRALRTAATEAAGLGHHGSALTLWSHAWTTARRARRRGAAADAAKAAAEAAARAGLRREAERWRRCAARLERRPAP